jgi:hypothetical protein
MVSYIDFLKLSLFIQPIKHTQYAGDKPIRANTSGMCSCLRVF